MKLKDKTFMGVAKLFAENSYCKRSKVGACIVKDNRILATGYNGTLPGRCNKCEYEYIKIDDKNVSFNEFKKFISLYEDEDEIILKYKNKEIVRYKKFQLWYITNLDDLVKTFFDENCTRVTKSEVLHAEQNLITFCAKNGIPMKDTIMYITMAPCKDCAKLIASSGIKEVVYMEDYHNDGIDLLIEFGIIVRKYND